MQFSVLLWHRRSEQANSMSEEKKRWREGIQQNIIKLMKSLDDDDVIF
jgi:hypothetical protein